jgi:hypothetical protein
MKLEEKWMSRRERLDLLMNSRRRSQGRLAESPPPTMGRASHIAIAARPISLETLRRVAESPSKKPERACQVAVAGRLCLAPPCELAEATSQRT